MAAGLPLEVPLDEEPEPDDDDPEELELRPRRIGGVFACKYVDMHTDRPLSQSLCSAPAPSHMTNRDACRRYGARASMIHAVRLRAGLYRSSALL